MEYSTFEDWYEALKKYADEYGDDWSREDIEECGDECWRESYNDGMSVEDAFREGFTE